MFKISINGIHGDIDMQIVDATGRIVSSQKLIGVKNGFVKEIDGTNLADGVYYIKFINNDLNLLKKLIIH